MATTTPPSSSRRHQSLFFRDLATPISSHRHSGDRFSTPGQAAAVSALRRNTSAAAAADPPPPPVFTLDDRIDFSPEPFLPNYDSTPTPPSAPPAADGGWWSPMRGEKSGGEEKTGRSGSPVEGVVKRPSPPTLLMLPPPPREVARPEMRSSSPLPAAEGMDEEEWVTVYGFFPGDTNLVLREFEKCGVILKHVPGPRDANWMHILYQNRYDAQKALRKNGVQLNNALIVGVKPVDPVQRQYLNERLSSSTMAHGGFMVSSHPPPSGRTSPAPVLASSRLNQQQNGQRSSGVIATPTNSVLSKMMDLVFGL